MTFRCLPGNAFAVTRLEVERKELAVARAHSPSTRGLLPIARSLDDFDEAAWVQACATDKSAVDVGLAH
jgi:hypothetical protein